MSLLKLSLPVMRALSGPVLRDTARLSQRYPPIARYGIFGVSTWPIGCDTPSPFSERFPLGEHAKWRCDIPPPQKGYLSDTCAIPYENTILSRKGIARYGGVSRTGPLSESVSLTSDSCDVAVDGCCVSSCWSTVGDRLISLSKLFIECSYPCLMLANAVVDVL